MSPRAPDSPDRSCQEPVSTVKRHEQFANITTVGNITEGTINANYKAIIEVFIEVYFKVITRRNIMFVRSQIIN